MSDQKNRGLYGKFKVERVDGGSAEGRKHEGCQYFVLDLNHDCFAFDAVQSYADACEDTNPKLADDLRGYARDFPVMR